MIARFAVLLLCCLAFALPAQAQLTATYKPATERALPFEMKIEIAPNGDLRGTFPGNPAEVMTLAGESYMISGTGADIRVVRVSDLTVVMTDYMREMHPELAEKVRQGFAEAPPLSLVKGTTVTVNGRTGTAWLFDKDEQQPIAVISTDPALAPLGKAMAAQMEGSISMMSAMMGESPAFMTQMRDILRSGAPLSFAGVELVSVSTDPIPAGRFVLPAEPLSREQLSKEFKARGGHFP